MEATADRKPATAQRPERFVAWVCSSLRCPPSGERPQTPRSAGIQERYHPGGSFG